MPPSLSETCSCHDKQSQHVPLQYSLALDVALLDSWFRSSLTIHNHRIEAAVDGKGERLKPSRHKASRARNAGHRSSHVRDAGQWRRAVAGLPLGGWGALVPEGVDDDRAVDAGVFLRRCEL